MTDTPYEEVRRCPACTEPAPDAERGGRLPGAERGSSSLKFTCDNPRCRWFKTSWIVQLRKDGTIPPPLVKRQKHFVALPPNFTIADSLQTLHELSMIPGTEITR